MFGFAAAKKPILTPCIGVCAVGMDDLCQGCYRTLDEITRWGSMPEAERARIMNEVLPEREAAHR